MIIIMLIERRKTPLFTLCELNGSFLEQFYSRMLLHQIWLKLAQWFGRKRFLISSMYFCNLVITSLWKRAGPFIWTNLNPLYPRMHYAKFGWNWPSGSGKVLRFFIISSIIYVFSLFCNYLPGKRAGSFIWANLNPLYPRMLSAKFGWFWRRRWKCEKVTTTTTTTTTATDKFWSEKLTLAFGSGELKINNWHWLKVNTSFGSNMHNLLTRVIRGFFLQ